MMLATSSANSVVGKTPNRAGSLYVRAGMSPASCRLASLNQAVASRHSGRPGLGPPARGLAPRSHYIPEPCPISVVVHAKGEDRSWAEIWADTKDLAKSAAAKVAHSLGSAAENVKKSVETALTPHEDTQARGPATKVKPRVQGTPVPEDSLLAPFGGGLLGKAMGSLAGAMAAEVGRQLSKAAEETEVLVLEASARIKSDQAVKSRLGSVTVGPTPVSQSSSTMSINGKTTKQISLVLPVLGERGKTAFARVESSHGGKGQGGILTVSVQMPEGDWVTVDGGRQGVTPAGTIDVEFEEISP